MNKINIMLCFVRKNSCSKPGEGSVTNWLLSKTGCVQRILIADIKYPSFNDLIVSNIKSFFKNQWPNNHIDRSIRSGCFFTVKNRKNIFINSRNNFICL